MAEYIIPFINQKDKFIEYTAGQEHPYNREEIYAAMIIYGLLSYNDGQLRIPNKELMLEFHKALNYLIEKIAAVQLMQPHGISFLRSVYLVNYPQQRTSNIEIQR